MFLEFTSELIINYGLVAIFFLMILNGVLSAPPSEVTLALAGIYVAKTDYMLHYVVLIASFGNIIGALILYFVGLIFGKVIFIRLKQYLMQRNSSILKFISKTIPSEDFFDYIQMILNSKGAIWVGILRCFPLVRSIISLPAGMSKMNFFKFIFLSFIGIITWSTLWVIMGYILNESWKHYGLFISIILILILVVLLLLAHKKVKRGYLDWKKLNFR